jgi:timeless
MDSDETYYLWAMTFFMEFSRHLHFRVDIVG